MTCGGEVGSRFVLLLAPRVNEFLGVARHTREYKILARFLKSVEMESSQLRQFSSGRFFRRQRGGSSPSIGTQHRSLVSLAIFPGPCHERHPAA